MKKIYSVLLLCLCAAFAAQAQSFADAYTFAQSSYQGSAYSMGIGNAVTALGGDLGTIGINPAGSAVRRYSQFTITPGLNLSLMSAAYAPDSKTEFGESIGTNRAKMSLPNVGVVLYGDVDDGGSLKAMSFGFVCNTTNNYLSSFMGKGYQQDLGANHLASSKMAELAYWATNDGLSTSSLTGSSPYYNTDMSNYWDVIMGYNAGLFNEVTGAPGTYAGCTEVVSGGDHFFPGSSRLLQRTAVATEGNNTDMLVNFGFDFNHRVFLGFNIGIPMKTYAITETIGEYADPVDNFPVRFNYSDGTSSDTYFKEALYRYNYTTQMEGAYVSVGVIALPTDHLRLGASIQTPTSFSVRETWRHTGKVSYEDGSSFGSSSLLGEYEYTFIAPWRFNLGLAYNFGRYGLVSFDYEGVDYSSMKFKDADGYDTADYYDLNQEISKYSGLQRQFRLGAEANLTPFWSLRAGANLITGAEKYEVDSFTEEMGYVKGQNIWSVSTGLGYKSRGSFFADLAVKYTRYPDTIYSPYADYGASGEYEAPDVYVKRGLMSAALTLGWRF